MKETKQEIMQRKIRNGKRKQFNKLYGSQKQIMDKLNKDHKPIETIHIGGGGFTVVKTKVTPKSHKLKDGYVLKDGVPVRVK